MADIVPLFRVLALRCSDGLITWWHARQFDVQVTQRVVEIELWEVC